MPVERLRRRAVEGAAGHPGRAVRLGDVRQRARVPGDERPFAAARDPDDDPGAVAEARVDESRSPGLLRVPLVADGALGRSGVDRVHRRDRDRRDPRPERPPSLALLRHQGRAGRHGLRGGRARHPAGERAASRSASIPAGSSWSTRRRAGSSTTGDQEPAGGGAPMPMAPGEHGPPGRPAPRRALPAADHDTVLAAADRVRATRTRTSGSCWRRWRRTARPLGLDGHRHGARGPLEPAAPALRLLQAAVRPGHEPSLDQIREELGDVDGVHDRAGGEPPGGRAEACRQIVDPRSLSSRTTRWRSSATSSTRGSRRRRCP